MQESAGAVGAHHLNACKLAEAWDALYHAVAYVNNDPDAGR